ncbi:MAG TPA: hypothetical protein VFZ83_12685 [Acidimicrobiia bacterium]|nr:hypothetical protein [Acidimicrobiia bacterium]
MRTARQRKSDAKLIAATAALIVVLGSVIAAGIYVATTSGDADACGIYNAGFASALAEEHEDAPSPPLSGGGSCSFILAVDGGTLVAVKPTMTVDGEECGLVWRDNDDAFRCGDAMVTLDEVDRYPTSILTAGEFEGDFIIDLRDDPDTPLPTG